MNINQQKSLEFLKNTRLPILPAGVPELLTSLTDDDISFDELSTIIERFPTITARLIALSNSAWFAPVNPIDSLSVACSRVGQSIVKSISIALAVTSPFASLKCPSFDVPKFWCRSLLVADIATSLADEVNGDIDKGMVRTASLLHNLGLLWLADQLPEDVEYSFLQSEANEDLRIGELLKERIGFDYAYAGSYLCKQWELPKSLIEAIEYHLEPSLYLQHGQNSSIVGHAVELAKIVEYDKPELIPETLIASLGNQESKTQEQLALSYGFFQKNQELASALF